MPHIVLTDEQAKVIEQSQEAVEVRRTDGRVISIIDPPLSPDEIADIERQLATDPRYTTEQTRTYIRMLEQEVAETGTCNEERAAELLKRLTPVR